MSDLGYNTNPKTVNNIPSMDLRHFEQNLLSSLEMINTYEYDQYLWVRHVFSTVKEYGLLKWEGNKILISKLAAIAKM